MFLKYKESFSFILDKLDVTSKNILFYKMNNNINNSSLSYNFDMKQSNLTSLVSECLYDK